MKISLTRILAGIALGLAINTNVSPAVSEETKETQIKTSNLIQIEREEKELFEVDDLPRPIVNSIIAGALVLTLVAVALGTGKSIKYDKEKSN